MHVIIRGLNIYTDNGVVKNSALLIANGMIKAIGDIKASAAKTLDFPSSWHLIPGMIDMHIHGAAGFDVMDATDEALAMISTALVQEGVTSFLATTMTEKSVDIENALKKVANYVANKQEITGAEILGINLEGPFLSAAKAGCQRGDYFMDPDISLFKHWQKLANNLIKIVTVAPELANSLEFIKYLRKCGVIASLGHSNVNYEQTNRAIDAGCTEATHLFNAMPAIHHRDPGAITALLLNNQVMTEIIADGIHSHPAILQLILRLKGADKVCLITDSMRAKYLADGTYQFGGQQVIVKDHSARLSDGTLAGSILKMDSAVRNMIKFTGCTLLDTIKMSAINPAKQLNIFTRKGSIAIGKDADLVILNENLGVEMTICNGNIGFSSI